MMGALPSPPAALGRGVVIAAGGSAPTNWPRVVLDDAALRDPSETVAALHAHWSKREPVAVEVACDLAELRAPETDERAPYELKPTFEFEKERLYFLARANNYDD